MTRRLLAVCVVIALASNSSQWSLAQGFGGNSAFRSSGSGSGGFGSGGFGSGGSGSGGFGSGGFGSSGFGGGGFGSSGFGSSGFGSSGFGGSGNSMFGNSGFGNSYGGGQNGGGQNFVGRDSVDMQNTFGQMGRAGTQFFNQMNRNMNRNNNNRQRTTKTIQNPPQPMRVEVQVAFNAARPAPSQLANTIRTRMAKILVDHHMSPPLLSMEGDTAVISGAAASESERSVIEQLIALEPGVRAVRNEMTVATPANAAVAPGAGS